VSALPDALSACEIMILLRENGLGNVSFDQTGGGVGTIYVADPRNSERTVAIGPFTHSLPLEIISLGDISVCADEDGDPISFFPKTAADLVRDVVRALSTGVK
jgi:hypothetical protein